MSSVPTTVVMHVESLTIWCVHHYLRTESCHFAEYNNCVHLRTLTVLVVAHEKLSLACLSVREAKIRALEQ